MMLMRAFLPFLCAALPWAAQAASCPGGGSLDVQAASDSLTLTPTPATTFNFGEHVIVSAAATGFTVATFSWSIDGPLIADYNEDLGTKNTPTPAAALPWSTTPLTPPALSAATVAFYWVPTASQVEPNNGPFTRNITLNVTKTGGGTCSATVAFAVERNETDINRQAEDFYTSNHRAATSTNSLFGHVVDEHIFWHASVHDSTSFPTWTRFLPWHGEFVRRFDLWRQQFGYNRVAPWYPGRPLPSGPQFDVASALRLTYLPESNMLPTYYSLSGGTVTDPNGSGQHKLADYASLDAFTASFEFNFHGQVHCNIGASPLGGSFFETSGPGFGSMCFASSPKDPMFWRWHGFIDVLYRNYCALHPASCPVPSPADPHADPWMADNAADVAANGTTPSPTPHWISPDVWNRRTRVTTDACVQPLDSYGDHVTTGGVVRNCGSSADHENPVSGVMNFLYGTLRNTRPDAPPVAYAEVGVYYALASSGLSYPTDFTLVPNSVQFVTLQANAGTTTSIGPIPWTPPPVPPSNDHYCLYLRVLSVQATPPAEVAGIDANVANNNNLAWRNIKVVAPGDTSPPSFFIVRNIGREQDRLTLRFEVPPALARPPVSMRVSFDASLMRAFKAGQGKLKGFKTDGPSTLVLTSPQAAIEGLLLAPRAEGHVRVDLGGAKAPADVTITQMDSRGGVDGGVTLRVAKR
jgi:hypothetical protein